MADLNVSLIMRLIDKISGPSKVAADNIERMGRRIGNAGVRQLEMADRMSERTQMHQSRMVAATASTAAYGYALYNMIKPAVAFEKSMAGVGKVIDFSDENGLAKLGSDIQRLSTEIPMTAAQISALVESAGQSGIVDAMLPDDEKRKQLLAFAQDAGRIGIAFDMTAEATAAFMKTSMTQIGLTRTETISLADAVNHLSNKMNAEAGAMASVIQRQGAIAKTSGLAKEEIAALSAVMLANAPSTEIAATAMKNFLRPMTASGAATEAQAEAFGKLGLKATEVAQRMQNDAQGAIQDVIAKIGELDAVDRPAVISKLFGEESKGVIAGLVTNLEQLPKAFELVSDENKFAGSAMQEFLTQANTTANKIDLLVNNLSRMVTVIADKWLPIVNDMANTVSPVVMAIAEWSEANPELVKTIGYAAAGLLAFKVAVLAVGWAFLPFLKVVTIGMKLIGWMGVSLGVLIVKFATIGGVIKAAIMVASRALIGFGAAIMLSPITWVIVAIASIAAGAYLIYKNWDKIADYFEARLGRVKAAFQDGFGAGVMQLIAEGKASILDYVTWVGQQFNQGFIDLFGVDLYAKGEAMMQSLKDGILSLLPGIVTYVSDKLSGIMPAWMKRFLGVAPEPSDASAAEGNLAPLQGRAGTTMRGLKVIEPNEAPTLLLRSNTPRPAPANLAAKPAAKPITITIGETHHHYPIGIDATEAGQIFDRKLRARNAELKANLHDGGRYGD